MPVVRCLGLQAMPRSPGTVHHSQVNREAWSLTRALDAPRLKLGHSGPISWRGFATPARPVQVRASTENGASADDNQLQQDAVVGAAVATVNKPLGRVLDTQLRSEMEKSYLMYAMSVIMGRALPDVRDGLKPVHRRILYAMYDLGLTPNKPFRKSARVVGEVLGKYHPHGDSAVYDALVRLAQPFSMRLPLINGHGNFGSQDNDPPAAMRYTECRLQTASTSSLLADIEYDTVKFLDTFDGAQQEPTVLPARLPTLLINGSQGIAVGMATNIPPHNIGEVVEGLKALIRNPDITTRELMKHIPGPDFPTGGEMLATDAIYEAYDTGRGSIVTRAKVFIEGEDESARGAKKRAKRASPKTNIVITQLPFQVNKADLVAKIAALIEQDALQGIADVRDESDREGMRIVVETKRGFEPEVILNSLYAKTRLQARFPCNLVALLNGQPQTVSLKQILQSFLDFRCEVVTKKAQFELAKAERRAHIVGGLLIAQSHLDEIVELIRKSSDASTAADQLQSTYSMTPEQADAVLNMTLRRLTSMESGKLQEENRELTKQMEGLNALLNSKEAIEAKIAGEADELVSSLGDPRRTVIRRDVDGQLKEEELIPDRQSLIVFSEKGFIKRMTPDYFSTQNRGGKGMRGAKLRENDSLEDVQPVTDLQTILFLTNAGAVYAIKAYEIPQATRSGAGTALWQLLKMPSRQKVTAMLPVSQEDLAKDIIMLTKNGWLKRTSLEKVTKKRRGTAAITLTQGDELVWVRRANQGDDIMIALSNGLIIRNALSLFRPQGAGRGLQAVTLDSGVHICGCAVLPNQGVALDQDDDSTTLDEEDSEEEQVSRGGPYALLVTEKGLGKRTAASQFRQVLTRRSRGVRCTKLQDDDQLAAFHILNNGSDILISTAKGLVTRISADTTPLSSRTSRGSILMRMSDNSDKVTSVAVLDAAEHE